MRTYSIALSRLKAGAGPVKVYSIARRVVLIVLVSQLLAAAVLCGAAFLHEKQVRLRALDAQMEGRANALLGAIQDLEDPADNVFVDPAELRVPDADSWAVFNLDGRLVGYAGFAKEWRRGTDGVWNAEHGRVQYRVLQMQALRIIDREETGGAGIRRPVILLYAAPQTHLVHEALESASFYLIAVLVVGALTALLVAELLRSSTVPIAELAASAERLSLPLLDFAAPASVERVAELRPLAAVLREVTGRLREAFAREQRFLGDAAHELKTAIAVERSTIEVLLLKERTEAEYREGMLLALEDNRRLERLVAQMLTLSRMEEDTAGAGKACDLTEVVRESVVELRSMALRASVAVSVEAGLCARVGLSAERAGVLVTNLLANAIQYSEGGQEVLVGVAVVRGTVTLMVEDHGAGIAAEALPHVFERFFRADASRTRQTGGSGLGLAIAKSIVDSAGGLVEVRSEVLRGTTVVVTFRQA